MAEAISERYLPVVPGSSQGSGVGISWWMPLVSLAACGVEAGMRSSGVHDRSGNEHIEVSDLPCT